MNTDPLAKCQRFLAALAHMRKLNMQAVAADKHQVTVMLPVQEALQNHQFKTYMHGGVLTTLVDTASSMSTLVALDEYELCPTLDLRIDHMSTPQLSQPLYAQAECYRITRSVLFTRATVYQASLDQPVAYAIATFMRPESGTTDSAFKALIDGTAAGLP